jgi:hypothetical protein
MQARRTSHRRPADRRPGLVNAAPQQPCLDMRRFEPTMPAAAAKVDELLKRGAVLTAVTRTKVTLIRMGQTATVDHAGRVEWLH